VIRLQQIIDEFRNYPNKYEILKRKFNTFQKSLSHFESKDFPIKGISTEVLSDTKSLVRFLDREYEFRFSSSSSNNELSGKITVFLVLDRDNNTLTQLDSTTFKADSIANIQPPPKEARIRLDVENDCLTLAFNWIYNEINS
jgi:hypothetical protein